MDHSDFLPAAANLSLADCGDLRQIGRENLGADVPVAVYRLLEYSLREELTERFGKDEQIKIFRGAGYRAGAAFAERYLDLTLDFPQFISQLQYKLEELKIGVLRVEEAEEAGGKIVLTISEDADCSGLPTLGETVCNYDEGFLSGLFTVYCKKPYSAVEINCWATGDRVCRFQAEVMEE